MGYINEHLDDTLIIHLPIFAVEHNPELKEHLKKLIPILEHLKFGGQHPDIDKSIFEIEEYSGKKELQKTRADNHKKKLEENAKENELLLSGKKLPIIYGQTTIYKFSSDDTPSLTIGDTYFENVLTDSYMSIKKKVLDEFDKLDTFESIFECLTINGFAHGMSDYPKDLYRKGDLKLGLDKYSNLIIKFKVPYILVHYSGVKNRQAIYTKQLLLSYDSKGYFLNYLTELGVEEGGVKRLTNYNLIDKKYFIQK